VGFTDKEYSLTHFSFSLYTDYIPASFIGRGWEDFMNIYVGNLAADVDAEELRTLFEEFGKVDSCVIIKDRFTGESRGFGFVEMPTKDEAEQAISALNGKDLKGSSIKVNEARPRKNRWNNRRRRKGFYGR